MTEHGATVDETLLHALDKVEAEIANPVLQRQFDLEAEMIEDGRHRYWDRVLRARPGTDSEGRQRLGEESRTPASQCLLRSALNPIRDGVVAFIAKAESGKAGRRHMAVKHLKLVDPETVSFIAIKRCLDSFSVAPDLTNLCIKIGRALEDEVRLRLWEKDRPWLLKAIRSRFATKTFHFHRRVLNTLGARYGVDMGEPWSKNEALQCGSALLTIVIEQTGLFEVVTMRTADGNPRLHVHPTAETAEWVRKCDASAQFLYPTYMPTIVMPKPWEGPTGGGYHYGLARKLRLVKNRNRGYQSDLRAHDLSKVYRSINALQETPWQINHAILRHLLPAAKSGTAFAGLPDTRVETPIPAPADIPRDRELRTAEQQERLVTWKSQARAVHEGNMDRRQKGLVLARTIAIAEKYADEESLFFPYTLDFRGRAYPAASFLQPQGCDYQKALLMFAEGKALGEDGAPWLAIHGANLMSEDPETGQKVDKGTLQERIDWVVLNEHRILAAAADPDASEWWTKADSPWQFLAFCFEWAGFKREGEAFVSYLPVALDGSCNGLQHFSAMLRDEVGGAAVNLIPHERPADIYMEVCKAALGVVSASEAPEAQAWLASGQIDRGLCKRPVMTMPYGSKKFGIRDQILQELRSRGFVFHEGKDQSDGWAESGFLSGVIWDAIASVVVKAREAMDWLQACARVAAGEGLPIQWETPDGFPVLQDYRETHTKQVKTQVAGKLLWPKLKEEDATLSKHRQQNGIAPNFVHSMDGCAMRSCVNLALERGIDSFAMIHDSYATHAADTEVFYGHIRAAFVEMYTSQDVLAAFRDKIISQVAEERRHLIPALPEPGSLDLTRVLESDFFFA